jgi:hypothetical protein
MNTLCIPQLPDRVSASELVHGDDEGFIINAYVALQRQWPDEGGYLHYRYLLSRDPGARASVLRELAASATTKKIGPRFTDDLPQDHVYDPQAGDPLIQQAAYVAMSQRLRLLMAVRETQDVRVALGRLSADAMGAAVDTIARQSLDTLARMESRMADMQAEIDGLRLLLGQSGHGLAAAAADDGAPTPDSDFGRLSQEVLRLNLKLHAMALEQGRQESPQVGQELGVVKRQLADYVNAIIGAQRNLALVEESLAADVETDTRQPAAP